MSSLLVVTGRNRSANDAVKKRVIFFLFLSLLGKHNGRRVRNTEIGRPREYYTRYGRRKLLLFYFFSTTNDLVTVIYDNLLVSRRNIASPTRCVHGRRYRNYREKWHEIVRIKTHRH